MKIRSAILELFHAYRTDGEGDYNRRSVGFRKCLKFDRYEIKNKVNKIVVFTVKFGLPRSSVAESG
jgi:hypothetical protein